MEWSKLLCAKRQREYVSPTTKYDRRTEFQKDYHRIIGSASFRRLQDKTQVFPLDRSDFVRTRLTHSLEVSSFAKSLGQSVFQEITDSGADSEVTESVKENICSILECAGLIHDIGNPPFGHFGEDYIRSWFRKNLKLIPFGDTNAADALTDQMRNDLYNFEGNAQALRLITKLHFLVDGNGMNLNYALLNTIIKYPVSSLGIDKSSGDIRTKKMGYYYAEQELFNDITTSTGAYDRRYPLTFILEAADDIAYKTADTEDAVIKGFITYSGLLSELRNKYLPMCEGEGEREELRKAADRLESYYEKAAERKISSPEHNAVQRWIIYVQGVLLRCAESGFIGNYADIMNGSFKQELLSASDGRMLAYALSDIAFRYVFSSGTIYKLEISAAQTFDFLLKSFVNAAVRFDRGDIEAGEGTELDGRLAALISENYIRSYLVASRDKTVQEKLYLRLLLATDYICGMTDSFAKRLYMELSGNI